MPAELPEVGSRIRVRTSKGFFEGIVMPRPHLSDPAIVTIKLPSGYNVGVALDDIEEMEVLERPEERCGPGRVDTGRGKTPISFVSTGGTIASYVDYATGAVHPALTAEELAFAVPEVSEECEVRARVFSSVLSEDMEPRMWPRLAECVAEEFEGGSAGVVIPHGTDTMGYTSAALSFMLPRLPGPVVLVGAQRSSDRPSSDAYMNLRHAVKVAKSDLGEVVVVMHATISDTLSHVHRGTRVRKMHTSRRDAFRSINAAPLGEVSDEGVRWFGERRRRDEEVKVVNGINDRAALLHFYPGMPEWLLEDVANRCDGVVLAGTGLGHISSHLIPVVRRAVRDGTHVFITSQCLYGTTNLNVYSTGRRLLEAGAVPLGDMLPETAYVKLMWAMGSHPDRVVEVMKNNIAGEISERRMITW